MSALPPLEYGRPDRPPKWFRRPLPQPVVWLTAAALFGLVLLVITLPTGRRMHDSGAARCASNLHQVGLGIILFQGDHDNHYPASVGELLAAESLPPEVLVCPLTDDTAAEFSANPTTRQATTALAAPGHLSYVYCGHADWTDATVPADAVVMYEPVANHGGTGAHVLFGDGHVDWVAQPRAARLIAAAAATTRPVSAAAVP